MNIIADSMSQEEKLPIKLRALYRKYGYQIYKMSDFESYDLYRENKNFLSGNTVLTFTDIDGELMALKPDVTLSIAKDIKKEEKTKKLFYSEHVFRPLHGANKFVEIKQMGLEYIGADSGYAEAEVVFLAAESLRAISEDYFLGISHMGYVSALMDSLVIDERVREELIFAIRRKSIGDMMLALAGVNISEAQKSAVQVLVDLPADIDNALAMMQEKSLNSGMVNAVNELKTLLASCREWGIDSQLRIELSLINDLEYYTGIVFQGYIKGIPRAVLSGGRYDGLLQRFGKSQPALGFALYLNEIRDAISKPVSYDVDTLLIYDEQSMSDIVAAVNLLIGQGKSVRVEKEAVSNIRARAVVKLDDLLKEGEK